MSKLKRRLIYLLIAVGMILLLFIPSQTVLADEEVNTIPVTETIYWAISNVTLTISDEEVPGDIHNSFSSKNSIQNSNLAWCTYESKSDIKNVVVAKQISPANLSYWFNGLTSCENMQIELLDTSNATTMANMFEDCSSLTTIDVSHFNTSNVKNMSSMFYGCTKLVNLDLTGFDTSNVTNLSSMLYRCSKLTSIDLSSFQTENVTQMRFLFSGCSSFQELDLTFITANAELKANGMLNGLTSLKKITVNDEIIPFLSTTNLQYNWYSEELEEFTKENPISSAGTYYKTCKVVFHGDDTNIVGTKYVIYNTTTDASGIKVPDQVGYLFSKWVTSRMGNIEFDFSVPITQDVDVYAGFVLCSHEYEEWSVTKETACDEAGSRHRFCTKCGYEDIEVIPRLDHVLGEFTPKTDATCTTSGEEAHYFCSVCEKYYDESLNYLSTIVIDPLGHTYDEPVWNWNAAGTEATASFTCTVCNHKENVSATVTEEIVDPATCISSGAKKVTATIELDGQTYTESFIEALPMIEHEYGIWNIQKDSTCVEEGWIPHYHCSLCNKNFDKDYKEILTIVIPALGHQYEEEWSIDVPATCEEEGSKSHHCIRCDSKISSTPIEAIGHDYAKEWTVATPATCLEKGIEEKVCAHDATHRETREIPALGHAYATEWTISKSPTCTENGIKEKVCAHDATHKQIEVIPSIGHEYSTDLKFDETGHFHVCSNCQDHKDAEEHTYGEWELQREATEYSDGLEVRHCEVCGYGQTHILPKLKTNALSVGAIIGIVLGSIFVVLLILYLVGYFCLYKKEKLKGKFFDGIYLPMRKIFK